MQQPIQGTPVIMQQPAQGTGGPTVYVMVDNEKKETMFAKKAATALSIVQLILGIISTICQVVIIILLHTHRTSYNDYLAGIGEGIYCGIFFIITIIAGSLGLLASRKPSTCNISAFMTLSIIASIFSAVLIIIASMNLTVVSTGWGVQDQELKIAMFSIMVLSGLVEGVVSIICAAICCRACCCTGGGSTGRLVYLAQGQDGSGATPVQIAGGVPVQMAYLPQPMPATEALVQNTNELPSYGDVVKEEQEDEGKEKNGGGGYKRF